ncbi:DUF4097 family beta strand repeat protein [Helcococcus kunzii]|uniref:Uncharacterized protein n=1 Tax=Helcococcus kunzii ATCC 51366 TaxID=883114 RepID=H3NP01_9FIRM|nr:DUF4097 family beta strand repeat-containing protein [Helcococcus kunzii]EHR34126.1 hypothetical protein HMPREF9709_01062 [Helcococcus kunzii ATCC 51366]QZO75679.1 DUF4097 family beta strand repeat protein [Helcococcus kunzii]
MSEEKKLILNMLKEGKITEDEALKLLDAIGEKEKKEEEKTNFAEKEASFENSVNNFVNKILSGVETAINKAGDVINNMDFDISNINIAGSKFNANTTKTYKIEDIEEPINFFVNNLQGAIQIQSHNQDYIECIAIINYDNKYHDENDEFLIHKIEDNNHYFGIDLNKNNWNFKSQLIINLPKDKLNSIKVRNSNSKIQANNFDIDNVIFETTNARIEFSNITSKSINATTTNAKIEAINVGTDKIVTNTTNSKISLSEIKSDELEAYTTNGKINLTKLNVVDVIAQNTNGSLYVSNIFDDTNKLDLSSTNGGIYIEGLNFERSIKASLSARNSDVISPKFSKIYRDKHSTKAYTENYDENAENTLDITAVTTNGKISIL